MKEKMKRISWPVSVEYHKLIKTMAARRGISMGRMLFMAMSAFKKMEENQK